MLHLLGLLDFQASDGEVLETVRRMAERTRTYSPRSASISCNNLQQAAIACLSDEQDIHVQEGVLAGICGRPYWENAELSKLHAEQGAAAALHQAYRDFGQECLQYVKGPFALALIEPGAAKALIAVDRLGIETLAWSKLPNGLAFASRADMLLEHQAIKPSLNQQAIFDYFYSHMIPSPRSIFSGIEKLQPAQCLIFDQGKVETRFYWDIPYEERKTPVAQLEEELHSLLRDAVKRDIDSEATGAFLSGGLDSSTVTGYFAQLNPATADVYGIGFDAEGYDEMGYARATANHFGARLHEYYVTPDDVVAGIPKIAQAYDEPFGNSSAVPAYYCAQIAKQDGKDCLLAGDGGDEIFAGNSRYATQKIFALYDYVPKTLQRGLIEPFAFKTPGAAKFPPLRKLGSYVRQAKIPMPERLETYNFLHRTPVDQIFTEQCLTGVDPRAPVVNLKAAYDRAKTDKMLKRMLHLDAKITLADNDLRKVSRTCDQAGIDVRYPMLDERLVEFAARIPCSNLLKGFELRAFYRKAMKDFLAPETLSKSKHGFGLPFGVWMQHDKQLKELTGDSLQAFRRRDILRQDYIDTLLEAHRSEHADYYGVMIWVVMMLEQWLSSHKH